MPPPPASHSNPPNFRAGTNRPPAPNGAPQNPPRLHSPHSLCRIQFRLLCARSLLSPPPPRTPGSAFSPARLDFDTSAHPATAKPSPSSAAQSSLPKSARSSSPIVRRVKLAPGSPRPSRLPHGHPAPRLGQRIVSPQFDPPLSFQEGNESARP